MRLICGNSLEELAGLSDNSVDSVVTDPPYELGFMGKHWDSSGIAYNVGLWRECYRVLKPGGHLLSFGGSRTYHRMASAIEDAGFDIRDMVEWVYGSGFPKSLNIGKAIDKMNGIEFKNKSSFIGVSETRDNTKHILRYKKCDECGKLLFSQDPCKCEWRQYKAQNDWSGWGTGLKPAHESVCVARKPLSEKTVAENVLRWGVGGINVDGCRVEYKSDIDKKCGWRSSDSIDGKRYSSFRGGSFGEQSSIGRFPSNLIHDGSAEVLGVFPQTKSGALNVGHKRGKTEFYGGGTILSNYGNDSGSASRFFYCAKASKRERDAGLEGMVERNFHPCVKPVSLMRYLCRLVTPKGGVVLDPFMGSGSTGIGAVLEGFDFIGIDMEREYVDIAEARISYWMGVGGGGDTEDEQLEIETS